jgi:hypothetical protein
MKSNYVPFAEEIFFVVAKPDASYARGFSALSEAIIWQAGIQALFGVKYGILDVAGAPVATEDIDRVCREMRG